MSEHKRSVLHLPKGHPVHHPFGAVRHLRAFALRPALLETLCMSTTYGFSQPLALEMGRWGEWERS